MTTATAAPRQIDPEQKERIRTKRLRASSPANRQLRRLFELIDEAREVSIDVIEGNHSSRCRCNFCKLASECQDVDYVMEQLRGLVWAIESVGRSIDGDVEDSPEDIDAKERRIAANS